LRSGIWPSVASPDEYDTAQEPKTFKYTAAIGLMLYEPADVKLAEPRRC
jgi:hypothetical protein